MSAIPSGRWPFCCLPRLANHREARPWNSIFLYAQEEIDLASGTIKATVLIETLPAHPGNLLPDLAEVTMDRALIAPYAARLVRVCHRRGIHAMGGMSAVVPVRGDAIDAAGGLSRWQRKTGNMILMLLRFRSCFS